MEVLDQPGGLYGWGTRRREAGERIVLVPTMGALHDGHFSLVRKAKRHGDKTIVSIFVNPTQFAPHEDLDAYPRSLERDLAALEALDVDAVFAPEPGAIYPDGFDTYVVPDKMASVLCGASRPNHFRGVCTIVLLFFRISRCHAAVFGEKDFQQLQIIRRMNRDLWLGVDIIGAPIVREPDGLAMSSRNAYLSETERQEALALSHALDNVETAFREGERRVAPLLEIANATLAGAPSGRADYVELVDAETLRPIDRVERAAVCALAVFFRNARLIDNRILGTRDPPLTG